MDWAKPANRKAPSLSGHSDSLKSSSCAFHKHQHTGWFEVDCAKFLQMSIGCVCWRKLCPVIQPNQNSPTLSTSDGQSAKLPISHKMMAIPVSCGICRIKNWGTQSNICKRISIVYNIYYCIYIYIHAYLYSFWLISLILIFILSIQIYCFKKAWSRHSQSPHLGGWSCYTSLEPFLGTNRHWKGSRWGRWGCWTFMVSPSIKFQPHDNFLKTVTAGITLTIHQSPWQ